VEGGTALVGKRETQAGAAASQGTPLDQPNPAHPIITYPPRPKLPIATAESTAYAECIKEWESLGVEVIQVYSDGEGGKYVQVRREREGGRERGSEREGGTRPSFDVVGPNNVTGF